MRINGRSEIFTKQYQWQRIVETPTKIFRHVDEGRRMRGFHGAHVHFGFGATELEEYEDLVKLAQVAELP